MAQPLLWRWLARTQPAAAAHWQLGWRNLYVWPTRAGWVLLLVWALLLLVSVNYQLSLGYLLTFLLAGSVAAGVAMAHANVRGLQLQVLPTTDVFAGQTVAVQVAIQTPPGRPRWAILLALGERPIPTHSAAWSSTNATAGTRPVLDLGCGPLPRGCHRLPQLTVQTLYPLGAFCVWSHWQPEATVWVYPAPEVPPPALAAVHAAGEHSPGPLLHTTPSEPDGVRTYQRGDPLRHIVWKKAAQALATGSMQLVSRSHHAAAASQTLWLDEASTALSDPEARLSRLAAWVLQAQQQHLTYGLRLAHAAAIAPGSGAAHDRRCLQALAMAPGAVPATKGRA